MPGRVDSDWGATQGVVEPLAVSTNGIKTPQPIPAPVANESNPAGSDGLPARDKEDGSLSVADGEAAFEKPAVEKPDAAVPPFEGGEIPLDPVFVEPAGEENDVPESAEATSTTRARMPFGSRSVKVNLFPNSSRN